MNETGSASLFGLVAVMLISMIGLSLLSKRIHQKRKNQLFQELLLCTKESNGVVKEFYKRMSTSNTALKTLTISQHTSITIPIYGIFAAKSAKIAKKIIKGLQYQMLISYMKKILSLKRQGCAFSPYLYITPFQLKHLSFHRNQFDEAKLRRKKWSYSSYTRDKGKFIKTAFLFHPTLKIKSSLIKLDQWQ